MSLDASLSALMLAVLLHLASTEGSVSPQKQSFQTSTKRLWQIVGSFWSFTHTPKAQHYIDNARVYITDGMGKVLIISAFVASITQLGSGVLLPRCLDLVQVVGFRLFRMAAKKILWVADVATYAGYIALWVAAISKPAEDFYVRAPWRAVSSGMLALLLCNSRKAVLCQLISCIVNCCAIHWHRIHAKSSDEVFVRLPCLGYEFQMFAIVSVCLLSYERLISQILQRLCSEEIGKAARSLITVLCDADVMLDSELKIVAHSRLHQAFPTVYCTAGDQLDQLDFEKTLVEDDRPRFKKFVQTALDLIASTDDRIVPPPSSLHVHLLDGSSMGTHQAELFLVCLPEEGHETDIVKTQFFIGIKDAGCFDPPVVEISHLQDEVLRDPESFDRSDNDDTGIAIMKSALDADAWIPGCFEVGATRSEPDDASSSWGSKAELMARSESMSCSSRSVTGVTVVGRQGFATAGQPPRHTSAQSAAAVKEEPGVRLESSDGLPSVGSLLHKEGQCKPCRYFLADNCRRGSECHFCHLPHETTDVYRPPKAMRLAYKKSIDKITNDSTLTKQDKMAAYRRLEEKGAYMRSLLRDSGVLAEGEVSSPQEVPDSSSSAALPLLPGLQRRDGQR